MPRYEYKVVPAPKKTAKIRGVRGTENRFAAQLATLMNTLGAEGWEYQRTDTLPCEERQGLTRRVTVFQNMLVFRREIQEAELAAPAIPQAAAPVPVQAANTEAAPAAVAPVAATPVPTPTFRSAAAASAANAPAPAPGLRAARDVPEGKAPTVTATPPERTDLAAQ